MEDTGVGPEILVDDLGGQLDLYLVDITWGTDGVEGTVVAVLH